MIATVTTSTCHLKYFQLSIQFIVKGFNWEVDSKTVATNFITAYTYEQPLKCLLFLGFWVAGSSEASYLLCPSILTSMTLVVKHKCEAYKIMMFLPKTSKFPLKLVTFRQILPKFYKYPICINTPQPKSC